MVPRTTLTRLNPLLEEATAIVGESDLGRLLQTLVAEAKTATGAKYAALGVLGDHGVLKEFIYHGMSQEDADAIGHPPTGRGVLGAVIHGDGPLILEKISDHPDSYGFPDNHPEMNNFLGVPLIAGGESFGDLYLTEKEGGFTEDDTAVVLALSHIAGAAILTSRLQSRLQRIAIIEDRQRIARDLHDSVIQDLYAVGLGLQGLSARLEDKAAAAELDSAIDTLDDSVASLRKYIFELKSVRSATDTLDQRLEDLVARMAAIYPTQIDLSVDDAHDGPWVEDVVLLVTEALSNALRHSRASTITVTVASVDEDLVVEVVDDGIGFNPDGPLERGMGLSTMRSRAQSHGGEMTVTSMRQNGTKIVATFPLNPGAQRRS